MEQEIGKDVENLRRSRKSSLGMLLQRGDGSLIIKENAGLNNKAHSSGTSTDCTLPSKEAFGARLSSDH